MKSLRVLCITAILMLGCGIAFGQRPVGDDPSQEIIKELTAHLPNAVKTGKQLPPVMRRAVKELAKFYSNEVEVETLCARLVVVTKMDEYLNYIGVTDPKLRRSIKRHYTAFTINQHWPIYIH